MQKLLPLKIGGHFVTEIKFMLDNSKTGFLKIKTNQHFSVQKRLINYYTEGNIHKVTKQLLSITKVKDLHFTYKNTRVI